MTEEQYYREQLAMLHREYQKATEPIIRRLAAIDAMKQPEPMNFVSGALQWHPMMVDKGTP